MKSVAIIGAGAAGLCCARHFGGNPAQFKVQVFEKGSEVGGTWIYESSSSQGLKDVRERRSNAAGDVPVADVHSSMYKNLRTNFPKEIMCFPDFPFDPQLPSFPHHSDVLSYLRQYADQYDLHHFIKFNCLVESVVPVQGSVDSKDSFCDSIHKVGTKSGYCCPCETNGERKDQNERGFRGTVKWSVNILDLKTGRRMTEVFDFILFCSGHFFKPYIPDILGLQSFPGKVIHSHTYREPEVFSDTTVLVVGSGYSGRDIMMDLAGHVKAVCFCNRGDFLTCPLPSNVEQLPALRYLTSDGMACFQNGEERCVDTVILATGYEYIFPFLTEDSKLTVESGKRIKPLYKHTFNAVYPSMAIIGMNTGVMPFPYFDLQARWVMSVWNGNKFLPSVDERIRSDEETYRKRLGKGLPPHLASHHLAAAQWDFYRELAALGGSLPLNSKTEIIYSEWEKLKSADLMNYKYTNVTFDGLRYSFLMADTSVLKS